MKHKFPRTYHLPWSEAIHSDDKIITSFDSLEGEEVVITEKLDGENTTLGNDYVHARSIDSAHNFTRDWVKKMHSIIKHDIAPGMRLCGENLAYYHSIEYKDLESFFFLLSVWDENNNCLSYDDTLMYADLLDLATPKQFYRGSFDLNLIKDLSKNIDTSISEGFVVRVTKSFKYEDYSKSVTKWVRKDHVQPNQNGEVEHWLKNTYPNLLSFDKTIKPAFMTPSKKLKP